MLSHSQKGLIPFRNGVLDIETRELWPHSPANYLTWCLPYDYNPLASCDPIKQWLLEMLENVHVTDLDILEKDKFETANLKDKRLVIINEATSYKGVKRLKALTGGDRLRFEQKYKQNIYQDSFTGC